MSATHTPGRTTATARREAEDFTQPIHHMDLEKEGALLLIEAAGNASKQAAKTLSKDASMTVTIIAMTAGSRINDHSAHGSALMQTLAGEVGISTDNRELHLHAGQLITLARQVPHSLSARVDSVVLLVVSGDK